MCRTLPDETPTPTRFLQNCDEVGLFKEIEEEFLQAQEEEKNKQVQMNVNHCLVQFPCVLTEKQTSDRQKSRLNSQTGLFFPLRSISSVF